MRRAGHRLEGTGWKAGGGGYSPCWYSPCWRKGSVMPTIVGSADESPLRTP
ncbi:hypothetical protein STRAU_6676 [Streptomyces aurantiacus JA 4570]|uniref:Uncharacterized protein n=1 Tax=Streptomyces aurantiacus JA 4570 TaxID=1286094 RepID=S3ZPG6_9ACTN|nr:hypothetical protein STRAU_6676 [Streptomyces aurantiacus JA 4570]